MKTYNIHEAKTHLSRLVDEAVAGESFIIAKAGKPLVTVSPVAAKPIRRIGFMKGMGEVPDDFNTMFAEEIRAMFEDGPLFPDSPDENNK